jgi:hypothetical protein
MVIRTDRLWTGGNALKAAFASLHAYLSGAVAARVGLISRNRHGPLFREVSRHGQVRQRSLHKDSTGLIAKRHNI